MTALRDLAQSPFVVDPSTGIPVRKVMDSNGNVAVDSGGLVSSAVMKVLSTAFSTDNAYTTTSTTDVVISAGTVNAVVAPFNLTRQTNVMISALSTGSTSGGSGQFAYVSIYVDGVLYGHNNQAPPILFDKSNTGYVNGSAVLIFGAGAGHGPLAAGGHTVDMRVHVDSGQTWIQYHTFLDVFQLGS